MGIFILFLFCVIDIMIECDIVIVFIKEVENRIEVVVVWNKKNINLVLEKFIFII